MVIMLKQTQIHAPFIKVMTVAKDRCAAQRVVQNTYSALPVSSAQIKSFATERRKLKSWFTLNLFNEFCLYGLVATLIAGLICSLPKR